jgi:predicted MPP superfamily phosphohydrolase
MSNYRQINWIHISDIHFRAIDNWRDSPTRKSLLECIRTHIMASDISPPDLIFCTGDIGYGDKSQQKLLNQYKKAREFFNDLLQIVRLPVDCLFLVPGNHDVSRREINTQADAYYRTIAGDWGHHENKINNDLANNEKDYKDCMKRLKEYNNFISSFAPHLYQKNHTHYILSQNIRGTKIQIIGLNSAWNCSGSEDQRRLWVAAVAQLAEVERDDSIRIALIHHPLEWLVKSDSKVLQDRMGTDIHILLHGHEHEYSEYTFQGFPVIGTGAVSTEESLGHGFIYASLDLETGILNKKVFIYSQTRNDWGEQISNSNNKPFQLLLPKKVILSSIPADESTNTYKKYFSRLNRPGDVDDIDDDEYGDPIEPGSFAYNRESEYFGQLWHDAMSPHAVEKLAGDPEALHYDGAVSSTSIIQEGNLDAYFLRKKALIPVITRSKNLSDQEKYDGKIGFDVFVKEVSESPRGNIGKTLQDSENRVHYLIGDAGIGKTLTVLKLIDSLRISPQDVFGYTIYPIYIDLHRDYKNYLNKIDDADQVIKKIMIQIASKLVDCIEKQGCTPNGAFFEHGDNVLLNNVIRRFVFQLARMNISPFIIIDNSDLLFFKDPRFRFFEQFARKRDWYLEDTISRLVNCFDNEKSLGKIGVSVLIICRRYVYNHYVRLFDTAHPLYMKRQKHKTYQLIMADRDEITNSRNKLIADATQVLRQGGYRHWEMFEKHRIYIERLLNKGFRHSSSVLHTIGKLGHQEHRSFLTFLGTLPVDIGPSAVIAKRLFRSPNLLLSLYISNFNKKYSQSQGHFPNMFLNDALVMRNEIYQEARCAHIHSYWLKYLLLRWFHKQKNEKTESRTLSEDAIGLFVHTLNYEENLVRLALGSLSDPTTSSCLKTVKPEPQRGHIEVLQLTPRGEILVAEDGKTLPLCFNFNYLEMMVDDYLLALPRPAAKTIFVDADLGHILKSQNEYFKGTRATLSKKVPAVLTFFQVLVLSFELEAKYRDNFSKLQKLNLIPNFEFIRDQLLDSIGKIEKRFYRLDLPYQQSMTKHEPLPNPREIWKQVVSNDEIRQTLSEYYANPVNVAV